MASPPPTTWPVVLPLRGAGGEPVNLAQTLRSHGVANLPPNDVAEDGSSLQTVLTAAGGTWVLRLTAPTPERALLHPVGTPPPAAARKVLLPQLRHMLSLDDDLSDFYLAAAADPALAWATGGAGRLLRSPTVFEDVVKTLCTTNCTWAATVRMVEAIVDELGPSADGAPEHRAFPSAAVLAEADDAFYRDVARAGYRGAYLKALAADVAAGHLDLQALTDPALSDDEVAERLLALPGVGPYATAHVMMLLGRHRRLVLDSWTRPTYRRITGRARLTDSGIERAFRRYRQYAGLAFWLTLTEDRLTGSGGTSAERTA